MRKAGILLQHQLHPTAGLRIGTELAQRAEQVFKRRCPRTPGNKPLCAAVKAPLGWIALKTRYRKFRGRPALRTGDLDRCKFGQTDIQHCVAHSDPYIRPREKRTTVRPYCAQNM